MTGPEPDDLVVIYTPTVMDGAVVRWYRSEDAAMAGTPILSVSREGIYTPTAMHLVPAGALNQATELHRLLFNRSTYERGVNVCRDMATHQLSFMGRNLTRIDHQGAGRG